MCVIWGRRPEQNSFPLSLAGLAGESTGRRLQRVSVDWQPNVKIEMAFKADNESGSQSFSYLVRSSSNFSSPRVTGKFGVKPPRTRRKSQPMAISPAL